MPRCALGHQGIRLVEKLAEQANDQAQIEREQRERRRAELQERIEEASKRPAPGASNLLGTREDHAPYYWKGAHDLTGESGLLPIHLPDRKYGKRGCGFAGLEALYAGGISR